MRTKKYLHVIDYPATHGINYISAINFGFGSRSIESYDSYYLSLWEEPKWTILRVLKLNFEFNGYNVMLVIDSIGTLQMELLIRMKISLL